MASTPAGTHAASASCEYQAKNIRSTNCMTTCAAIVTISGYDKNHSSLKDACGYTFWLIPTPYQQGTKKP